MIIFVNMDNPIPFIILAFVVLIITATLITYLLMRARQEKACNALENELIAAKRDLENAQKLQQLQQESFDKQLLLVKSQLTAETEKLLQQREESLQKKAEETFRNLAGPLGKDLKTMQESFETQKRTQAEGNASLKTAVEQAVKHLQDQTTAIGSKADNLAQALKGQNKMTGIWGETILYNMLVAEGMEEGRDFDREETLRDDKGSIILNEDSGKRMRPDYILHYPDKTEVIVDAKTSMEALSDWYASEDPIQKEDAAKRNLLAIRTQIKSLSGKRYQDYIRDGFKTLDYVIMFIPNYGALQLAKTLVPNIFQEAYQQGVLLTTEETLMPFLRMIRVAWTNYDQVRNQEKIIKAAQTMIDRVADFAKAHAAMGDKLHAAMDEYDKVSAKISDSGNSIITSAKQLIKLGVPKNPKKPLPDSEE